MPEQFEYKTTDKIRPEQMTAMGLAGWELAGIEPSRLTSSLGTSQYWTGETWHWKRKIEVK